MKIVYKALGKIFDTKEEAINYEDKFLNNKELIAKIIIAYYNASKYNIKALALASEFTNFRKIKFGKYNGRYIGRVILEDKQYIDWCIKNIEDFKLNDNELILKDSNCYTNYYGMTANWFKDYNFNSYDIVNILNQRYLEKYKNPIEDKDFEIKRFSIYTSESVVDDNINDCLL